MKGQSNIGAKEFQTGTGKKVGKGSEGTVKRTARRRQELRRS